MHKPEISPKNELIFNLPKNWSEENMSSYGYLGNLYELLVLLLTKANSHNIWRIEYRFGQKFYRDIVPLIIASCIFNRKIRIAFNNASDYMRLDQRSVLSDFFLKKFDLIEVRSSALKRTLERRGMKAEAVPFVNLDIAIEMNQTNEIQPHMLFVGELEQITDLNSVLNAYQMVKQKYPRTEFTVCGYGSKLKSWSEQIEGSGLNGVNFVPYNKENLTKAAKKADVFINSFYVEYQSEFLYSAFKLGMPVISSPLGYYSDIKHLENILLVPFNKSSEIASRVIELVENRELVEKLKVGSILLSNKQSKR